MQNMNIYCPSSDGITPKCIIDAQNANFVDQIRNMQMYAPQGLNDVLITCDFSGNDISTLCYDEGTANPIIHCTSDFSASCTLQLLSGYSYWQCQNGANDICNDYTLSPSLSPTGILCDF